MTVAAATEADDRRFMAEAIRLSLQHTGLTETNPSVGCVIVKDGEIVGSAVTAIGGRPHAETQAIAMAGEKTRGATAYVTLEPCAHWGRTPPCANALVAAGVSRVVVAVNDPDPRVAGQGLKILADAGITVETGLLEKEGRRALAGYLMRQTSGRPYVTVKLAVSADGMLGRRGEEIAITSEVSRTTVHHLRAQNDAILVGAGTVLSDDPELTVRLPGLEDRSPIRIVLDRHGHLPQMSRLAKTAAQVPVIVAVVDGTPPSGLPAISTSRGENDGAYAHPEPCRCGEDEHADIRPRSEMTASVVVQEGRESASQQISALEGDVRGRTDARNAAATDAVTPKVRAGVEILHAATLLDLLHTLATRGISTLLVEGGATVVKAFLDAGLVDGIILFTSPTIVGEGGLESPLTPSDIPADFTLVGNAPFGRDRAYEYERSA